MGLKMEKHRRWWEASHSLFSSCPLHAANCIWKPSESSTGIYCCFINVIFSYINTITLQACTDILSFHNPLNLYSFHSRRYIYRVLECKVSSDFPVSFSENPSGIRNWSLKNILIRFSSQGSFEVWSISLESAFTYHFSPTFSRVFPVSLHFD